MTLANLTQANKDELKEDASFRKFLADSIMFQATYLLGLSAFDSQANAQAFVYSKKLREAPTTVKNDPYLVEYCLIQMQIRGLAKLDSDTVGSVADQTISALTSGVGYLVADYFAEKTKEY